MIPDRERQEALLEIAKVAASSHNQKEMFEALDEGGALEAVNNWLRKKWSSLTHDEVDLIVALAIDAFYLTFARGDKSYDRPMSLLFKIADRKASDHYRRRQFETKVTPEDFDQISETWSEVKWQQNAYGEDGEALKLSKGIAVARSLIPKLGAVNVQQVMSFVIDGVEAGRVNMESKEIGEALGLTRNTVRQCLSRGFKRLERVVTEEGLGKLLLEATHLLKVEGEK
jgi:DNA-directed RNA polymerase specialized sigma24 family protein